MKISFVELININTNAFKYIKTNLLRKPPKVMSKLFIVTILPVEDLEHLLVLGTCWVVGHVSTLYLVLYFNSLVLECLCF